MSPIKKKLVWLALMGTLRAQTALRSTDRFLGQVRVHLELRYCVHTSEDLHRVMKEAGWQRQRATTSS